VLLVSISKLIVSYILEFAIKKNRLDHRIRGMVKRKRKEPDKDNLNRRIRRIRGGKNKRTEKEKEKNRFKPRNTRNTRK